MVVREKGVKLRCRVVRRSERGSIMMIRGCEEAGRVGLRLWLIHDRVGFGMWLIADWAGRGGGLGWVEGWAGRGVVRG